MEWVDENVKRGRKWSEGMREWRSEGVRNSLGVELAAKNTIYKTYEIAFDKKCELGFQFFPIKSP